MNETIFEAYKPKFRHWEDNYTNARRIRETIRGTNLMNETKTQPQTAAHGQNVRRIPANLGNSNQIKIEAQKRKSPTAPTEAHGQNVREHYQHDICPDCGTASVPVEQVPDQALRGCPKCSETWVEDLSKSPTAATEAPRVHIAQYGEGASKFYASKRGSDTVATYKLGPDQRDEVNQLIEEAQNDIEAVLFRFVAQRDELLTELKSVLKHGSAGNESNIRAAIAKAEGREQ